MHLRLAWLFSIALGLAACTTTTPTEIIVVVSSDYAPATELARVVVTTSDETGTVISTEELTITASASPGSVTLPFSFGVRPFADAGRPFRLDVEGFAADAALPFITRRVTAPFVLGERRRLSIVLERACEQITCASNEETCIGGTCGSRIVPASALDLVVPGEELSIDAGAREMADGGSLACAPDPACDEAIHVEVGEGFACALRVSGRVACWGTAADRGQLGNGATTPSDVPVTVLGVTDAAELALGAAFACVASETMVSCWGANELGQLGRDAGLSSATPAPRDGPTASRLFTASVTACGSSGDTLSCWGGGLSVPGEALPDLCDGVACARTPVEQTSFMAITWLADEGHLCVAQEGHAACASTNAYGEVGDGTRDARTALTVVSDLALVWSVSTTARSSCAIDAVLDPETEESVSSLHCWGADDLGQLGVEGAASDRCAEDAPCSLVPVTIASVVQPIEVAGTGDTTCVREASGRVLCWGSDANGGLGDGVGAPSRCGEIPCARTPTLVRGLRDAIDLDGRGGAFCAARRTGGVVCWGRGHADLPLDAGPFPP